MHGVVYPCNSSLSSRDTANHRRARFSKVREARTLQARRQRPVSAPPPTPTLGRDYTVYHACKVAACLDQSQLQSNPRLTTTTIPISANPPTHTPTTALAIYHPLSPFSLADLVLRCFTPPNTHSVSSEAVKSNFTMSFGFGGTANAMANNSGGSTLGPELEIIQTEVSSSRVLSNAFSVCANHGFCRPLASVPSQATPRSASPLPGPRSPPRRPPSSA